MNLNDLAQTVHTANAKWWTDIDTGEPINRNKGELLALIHSEISECFEGESQSLMDDKLPDRKMGEVEIVDAMIRLLDYSEGFEYNLNAISSLVSLDAAATLDDLGRIAPTHIWNDTARHGLVGIHSRISQVLEYERKGRDSETIAVALGVCLIYMAAYGSQKGYDLHGAFGSKMSFNASREDHRHEARRIAGGKQF